MQESDRHKSEVDHLCPSKEHNSLNSVSPSYMVTAHSMYNAVQLCSINRYKHCSLKGWNALPYTQDSSLYQNWLEISIMANRTRDRFNWNKRNWALPNSFDCRLRPTHKISHRIKFPIELLHCGFNKVDINYVIESASPLHRIHIKFRMDFWID